MQLCIARVHSFRVYIATVGAWKSNAIANLLADIRRRSRMHVRVVVLTLRVFFLDETRLSPFVLKWTSCHYAPCYSYFFRRFHRVLRPEGVPFGKNDRFACVPESLRVERCRRRSLTECISDFTFVISLSSYCFDYTIITFIKCTYSNSWKFNFVDIANLYNFTIGSQNLQLLSRNVTCVTAVFKWFLFDSLNEPFQLWGPLSNHGKT